MSAKHTISINGRAYDAITGLPVDGTIDEPKQAPTVMHTHEALHADIHREPARHSASIHQQLHKSSTLRRGPLATPKSNVPVHAPAKHVATHVEQSAMISHFASHPKPLPKNRSPRMINDIGPAARQAVTAPSTQAKLPSREVKEQLIARAGKEVDHKLSAKHKPEKKKRAPLLKRIRKQHLAVAGVAALLLAGYVTYLNVPGISVRIAAVQAGVNADYPDYNPDGYSFQGPVAFQQGEVELHFKSNGGGEGYTITQQNSNWNSVAVLDNLVNKESNGDYEVNSTEGITVYTYGTRAAWTNGGVLYTIDGNAPLSSDQLLHIASSM